MALHTYYLQYFNQRITSFMWCQQTALSWENRKIIHQYGHYECDVLLLQNAVVRGILLGFQYMGKDEGGKGGVVVNTASVLGLIPAAGAPVYTATKHAMIGLTRSFGVSTAYSNVGILYWGRVGFCLLCSIFWVMPRSLNFVCHCFGIPCADTRPMKMEGLLRNIGT